MPSGNMCPQRPTGGASGGAGPRTRTGGGGYASGWRPQHLFGETLGLMQGGLGDCHH